MLEATAVIRSSAFLLWRIFIWFDFGRYCGIVLFPSFEDVIPAQSVTAGQAELEIGMSF